MAPTTSSLPALRGAGLTVTRRDSARTVVGQFDHGPGRRRRRRTDRADLWADDVIRGYRWEAEREGAVGFQSLVARVGTSTTSPTARPSPSTAPLDEGYVKGSSTTSCRGRGPLPARGHRLLERVEHGGPAAGPADRGRRARQGADSPGARPRVPADAHVRALRAAPGSPVLRYGHDYRLRARTVDLAANSVDARRSTDATTRRRAYLRWEPVPAPVVVPRREFGEGESQLRMVIRSTAGHLRRRLPRVAASPGHRTPHRTGLGYPRRRPLGRAAEDVAADGRAARGVRRGHRERRPGAHPGRLRGRGTRVGPAARGGADGALVTPYLPDVSPRAAAFAGFLLDPAIYRRQTGRATTR